MRLKTMWIEEKHIKITYDDTIITDIFFICDNCGFRNDTDAITDNYTVECVNCHNESEDIPNMKKIVIEEEVKK